MLLPWGATEVSCQGEGKHCDRASAFHILLQVATAQMPYQVLGGNMCIKALHAHVGTSPCYEYDGMFRMQPAGCIASSTPDSSTSSSPPSNLSQYSTAHP